MSASVTNTFDRDLVRHVGTVVNHHLAGNKGSIHSRISNGIGAVYINWRASNALGVTWERKCEYYKRKCTNPKHTAYLGEFYVVYKAKLSRKFNSRAQLFRPDPHAGA